MEKVRLKVLTVPALDSITSQCHVAFSVFTQKGGRIQHTSGWTLRDAVESYCRWFKVNRDRIVLERPFLPQRLESDGGE